MKNEHLLLSKVTIDFPTANGPYRALDDVNLSIAEGEFVSLIGRWDRSGSWRSARTWPRS